jgi:sec-independent protein translocase protein TatA
MFHNPLADGVVIVVILLLFFGPKRLPMLSRSIGESVKEFKGGINHEHDSDETKSEIAAHAPEAAPTSTTSSTTEHTNV